MSVGFLQKIGLCGLSGATTFYYCKWKNKINWCAKSQEAIENAGPIPPNGFDPRLCQWKREYCFDTQNPFVGWSEYRLFHQGQWTPIKRSLRWYQRPSIDQLDESAATPEWKSPKKISLIK
jgi:hypothetical protein